MWIVKAAKSKPAWMAYKCASFFCVQSPGPARVGVVSRGSGAIAVACTGKWFVIPFYVQSPGPARAGGVPRGSGRAQAVANHLCRSRRPGVHTAIICVGRDGRAYTQNYQLFMYVGAPRPDPHPHIATLLPPPQGLGRFSSAGWPLPFM